MATASQLRADYRLETVLATWISRELKTLKSRASNSTPGILGPVKFAENRTFEAAAIFFSPNSIPLGLVRNRDPINCRLVGRSPRRRLSKLPVVRPGFNSVSANSCSALSDLLVVVCGK